MSDIKAKLCGSHGKWGKYQDAYITIRVQATQEKAVFTPRTLLASPEAATQMSHLETRETDPSEILQNMQGTH